MAYPDSVNGNRSVPYKTVLSAYVTLKDCLSLPLLEKKNRLDLLVENRFCSPIFAQFLTSNAGAVDRQQLVSALLEQKTITPLDEKRLLNLDINSVVECVRIPFECMSGFELHVVKMLTAQMYVIQTCSHDDTPLLENSRSPLNAYHALYRPVFKTYAERVFKEFDDLIGDTFNVTDTSFFLLDDLFFNGIAYDLNLVLKQSLTVQIKNLQNNNLGVSDDVPLPCVVQRILKDLYKHKDTVATQLADDGLASSNALVFSRILEAPRYLESTLIAVCVNYLDLMSELSDTNNEITDKSDSLFEKAIGYVKPAFDIDFAKRMQAMLNVEGDGNGTDSSSETPPLERPPFPVVPPPAPPLPPMNQDSPIGPILETRPATLKEMMTCAAVIHKNSFETGVDISAIESLNEVQLNYIIESIAWHEEPKDLILSTINYNYLKQQGKHNVFVTILEKGKYDTLDGDDMDELCGICLSQPEDVFYISQTTYASLSSDEDYKEMMPTIKMQLIVVRDSTYDILCANG